MSDMNPPFSHGGAPYAPQAGSPPYGAPTPMTFGQILDRIFRLVRANVRSFLAIGAYGFTALILLEALFVGVFLLGGVSFHPQTPADFTRAAWVLVPVYILFLPFGFAFYGLYYGAYTWAALRADSGLGFTASEAFAHAWSRLGRYTWLVVVLSLIVVGPLLVIVLIVGVSALAMAGSGGFSNSSPALLLLVPVGLLCYLGFFVWAVVVSLRLSLAFCACMHEEIPAGQAIKRSGILTNGAKGRIFLALLVIYAIGIAVTMLVEGVGFFVFAIGTIGSASGSGHLSPLTIAIFVIGGLIVLAFILVLSALLMASYSVTFAVFYREQRMRLEGVALLPVQ
jgi:hypothetical protein